MNSEYYLCNKSADIVIDNDTREQIRKLCRNAGACAAGFASATAVDTTAAKLYHHWISAGCYADMAYLEKYDDIRNNPQLLLEGAQTVICCAFSYRRHDNTPSHPLFADYALGKDYHIELRNRLNEVCEQLKEIVPDSATRICIDTAPIRERYWAAKAGIGIIGLNNQLITDTAAGSRVFLAEILWTAKAEPDEPNTTGVGCLNCGKCITACPGQALDGKGRLDARRCLSYLTIEHRGELPEYLDIHGRKIYGCDICQNVCPMNDRNNFATDSTELIENFMPKNELLRLNTTEQVLELTHDEYAAIFRHSAVKRAKLDGLKRNAEKASDKSK